MSKLEELIQKYCPDGVEYKPLGKICNIKGRIGFRGYTRDDQVKEGEGALSLSPSNIQGGQMDYTKGTYITWAKYEESPEIKTYNGDIILCKTASVGKVALVKDLPYKATINPQLVVLKDIQCSAPFLTYVLGTDVVQRKIFSMAGVGSVPNIPQKALAEIEIPIPPLPVQEELVRVLDTFTELQAELQAELQKRLQQYEYYKWSVLESLSCPTKHITDVALVKARVGWQRLTTAEYQTTGDYYLITGTDFKNGFIDFESCVYVSKERYEMDPNIIVGKGDILITKDGTLGKVAFLAEEPKKPTTLNSGVFRIHTTDPQVSPRYLFHYFTSKYFTDFVNSVKTGSTIPHLTQQGLVSLNIPIPSLEEQNRVVSILDRFDTLTNDLVAGLPAEIEKRRRQYEFYRDKLLTFKRKEA